MKNPPGNPALLPQVFPGALGPPFLGNSGKKSHFSFSSQHNPDKDQLPGGSRVFGVGIWGRGVEREAPKKFQNPFFGAVLGWDLQNQHLGVSSHQ